MVLAIHGFWSGARLCLWAEDSDRSVKSPSQALRSARPHPFAAAAPDLAPVGSTATGTSATDPGGGTATLLLPSVRSAPLDSPELVRLTPRPAPAKGPALLPWSVPVVELDPAAALAIGSARDGEGMQDGYDEARDVRYGASVRFVAELVDFARDLVERGRVLPSLLDGEDDGDEGGASARWRPVLQGPDLLTAQDLVAAVPPVFRAEARAPEDDRGQSPADLVSAALHALVDAAMRERLRGMSLLPKRRGRPPRRIPVAEKWVEALSGADGRFDAEPDELDALAEGLEPWTEFGIGAAGPARATFRLVEVNQNLDLDEWEVDEDATGRSPDDTAAATVWRVEFLLQSVEDPSLLLPADQVWDGGDSLRRWLERPDELLLAELGRASTIYPALGDALRQARPSALLLDTAGAHDFLATRAGALDQAGFGILLPSWWSHRRPLGLRAKATTEKDAAVTSGSFSRESLVDFDWQLALGDEVLTADELAALAATKEPLVRLRGQWVAVDPEQVRRGLELLEAGSDSDTVRARTAAEVIALAAAHPDDIDTPLPVTSVVADGWLGDLLAGTLEQTLQPVPTPATLDAELRPYQQRGLSWLAFLSSLGLGGCLADDMGLGKTVQLLALEAHVRAAKPDTGPTLLLCPMSLVGNWQREAQRFAPSLRVHSHHGPGRLRGEALTHRLADTDLLLTTYQTATRDVDELEGHDWERLVLDEAQAVKNSRSKAAKAVRRLRAEHRVALTGTPVENRLSELWSIMDVVNPGLLGSPEMFRARYAIPVERHGETEPAERLRAITRPYVLRRLKTDTTIIDDLPEKIEIKQYCNLTAEQASLYATVVADMMDKIEDSEGIARRGNVLAAMTKLKQVCNHPAQLLHDRSPVAARSGKVIRLEEIVEEILAEGDRALLFTQFTEFAEMLLPHLAARFGTDVAYLYGGTPKTRRDELVARFQDGEGPPLFLLSLKAGGTGLNLTAANHVIHLDRWWNPAVENQATDRAFRIGQRRNVQVRKFVCVGTLEEKIDTVIEEKKALADLVVGDGEGWLTELSTGDLRELLTLSEGAVGE
ncbi:MAG: SNF2-related protein [Ornithinimicrobium sp.]|uniref:SNF2-related protein n=1 Tax=Ornithinimicrobium sp. TaxID=1977084 RepID=UPI003D9BC858